jgi:hypothetical protein
MKKGDVLQFKALKNNRNKTQLIFVREDGMVGFPTLNSITFKEGDIVKGEIVLVSKSYFMLRVDEIVEKATQEETEA